MASPWSVGILGVGLVFAVLCCIAGGFQWQSEDTEVVNGCVGSGATISWKFSKDPQESISTVHWFRFSRETIASRVDGRVTNPDRRFSPSGVDAGLSVAGLTVKDTGLYVVEVKVVSKDSRGQRREVVHTASALLTVGDPPSISGDKLTIQEVTSNEVCALQRQVTLSCGHFTKRGIPPVEVVWTDPAGQQLPSSRYADGRYHLDLPRRPLAGNYTCHVLCSRNPAILQCLAPRSPLLSSPPRHHLKPPASRVGCSPSSEDSDDDGGDDDDDDDAESDRRRGSESQGGESGVAQSQAVKRLEANVTSLWAKVDSLVEEQKKMEDRDGDRQEQFLAKVAEFRELVLLSNQQSGGAQLHGLQQTVQGLLTTLHDAQQNITALQQELARSKQQGQGQGSDEQGPDPNQRVEEVLVAVDDLRSKLGSNDQTIKSIEDKVSSLTIGLTLTQNTLSSLENALNVNVDDGDESSSESRAHQKNLTDLHQSLKTLEEMHEDMLQDLRQVSDAQKSWEQKQQNLTRTLGSLSFRVDALDRGVTRRVDKAVSQCNVTRSELGRLTWRLSKLEAEGGGGGGGGGGQPFLGGGGGGPIAVEEPGLDPLVSEARPSHSLYSPWDGKSDSLLHDFVITPDGQVVMADRYHADVIIAPNASMGEVISRPLRFGTHIRRMTYMQDGIIAATVDDHYIYVLDTSQANADPNAPPQQQQQQERWIRTALTYHGVAARSAQTLFVGVDASESGPQGDGARVDVISIVDDVAVVVNTVLNSSMASQLRRPMSLTVRGEEEELYVSDWDGGVVIRVSLQTLKVTVMLGPGRQPELRFFQPRQTVFDVSGNMYVSTGGRACGQGQGGKESVYSTGFCVVAVSQEGWWQKLIIRGAHIYPYGLALTPTGLAVSWGSWVRSPMRSLIQWYDLVDPNDA